MFFKRFAFLSFVVCCSFSFALDSLERITSNDFQNKVIRKNRMDSLSHDSSLSENQRTFAKAASLFYNGEWERSLELYKTISTQDSLFGYAILRIAETQFHLNQFEELRKTLARSTEFLTSASFEKKSLLLKTKAALLDTTLSDTQKLDSLATFLNRYPKSDESTFIRYHYAFYCEKVGKIKQAEKAYLRVLAAGYNPDDSTFSAVRRLRTDAKEETAEEKWAYTQIVCKNGSAAECLGLIDSVLALDSISAPEKDSILETANDSLLFKLPKSNFDLDTRKKIWEKRAVALRETGNIDGAYKQFRFLIDSVEAKALWMQSAIKLLRKDESKNSKTISELDSMLEETSKFGNENANNLWLRGFEFEQKKQYEKAIACYKKLDNSKFGSNKKRQWALFRIGLIYIKQKNYDAAVKTFQKASERPFTWSASGSRMFLGDAYLALGKDSLARNAYLDCIQDFPMGYYAHRSREKLLEANLLPKDSIPLATGVELTDNETFQWIQKQQKKKGSYPKETYSLVKKLLDYGFIENALELYQKEYSKNAKRLDFLYAYGTLFLEAGETATAYRLARTFQNRIDRKVLAKAPVKVIRFLYPLPYKERVFEKSGSAIDPYFVYSVMRQESIFDFQITSPVGARGLLQIMPATGKTLANLEGIENFEPDFLYNAYLNIRLGIRYLIDLKQEYNNDYMYVLGNYNAGPKPTKRWQKNGDGLPWDIRAEDISYWETRDYVKRVMGNYWIYQEIWKGSL